MQRFKPFLIAALYLAGIFALLIFAAQFGFAQVDNTFYAKRFFGATAGDKITAAQNACNTTLPTCVIVIDASLGPGVFPQGSDPGKCATCVWQDFRTPSAAAPSGGNAAMLNGYAPGNSSGNIAINNGTLNTNLNAEKLNGQTASYYAVANQAWWHPIVYSGTNDAAYTASKVVMQYVAPVAQTIPVNGTGTLNTITCTSGFKLTTAPTGAGGEVFTLYDNGVSFGTITFAQGATSGTIAIGSQKSVASGEVIKIQVSTVDANTIGAGLYGSLCSQF